VFEEFKGKFSMALVLKFLNFSKPFAFQTHLGGFAIRGV